MRKGLTHDEKLLVAALSLKEVDEAIASMSSAQRQQFLRYVIAGASVLLSRKQWDDCMARAKMKINFDQANADGMI